MKFRGIDSPCKGCPDRAIEPVNCHSICEKFKDYEAKHKAELEKYYAEKDITKTINKLNYESSKKIKEVPEPLKHGRRPKR